MDMMGKAMFSHHVGKLKEDLGLKEDEKEKTSNYDPQKEAEDEAQLAEQRQRRKDAQGKKQAERAANRNKIREKYGLKESKQDQHLVTQHGDVKPTPSKTQPSKNSSSSLTRSTSSQDKKDDKCAVM